MSFGSRAALAFVALAFAAFARAQSYDDAPPVSEVIRNQFSAAGLLELLNATNEGYPLNARPASELTYETWYPDRVHFGDDGEFQLEGIVRDPHNAANGDSEIRFFASGKFLVTHASLQSGLSFRLKGQVNVHRDADCDDSKACSAEEKTFERPLISKLVIMRGGEIGDFVFKSQRRAPHGLRFNTAIARLHLAASKPEE